MGVECPRILDRCGIRAFRTTEHARDWVVGSYSSPIQTSRTAGMGAIRAFVSCLSAPVVVAALALPPRSDGLFGFVRVGRRSGVMMCPELTGTSWAARCSRSPPWCRRGSAGILVTTARSAPRNGRGSQRADRPPIRAMTCRAVPGSAQACAHDGGCRGSRSTGCGENHPAAHGSETGGGTPLPPGSLCSGGYHPGNPFQRNRSLPLSMDSSRLLEMATRWVYRPT